MRNENHWGATLQPLEKLRIDPNIRRSVLVLFVAVAGVLLIACANVANLLLARATDRRREIAVRLAIGAGRGRLVRQLLTEAVTLGLTGGLLGIAFGAFGVRALAAVAAQATGVLGRQASGLTAVSLSAIRIDGAVLAFTLIASVLTGLLFGLVPALQATRLNLTVDLKGGGSDTIGFRGVRGLTSRSVLVSAEIAVAFILLVASGLMLKSLSRLLDTSAGVDPRNLMTVRITLPPSYTDRYAFWEQLLPRLATLPGVQSAGLTDCPPLSGGCNKTILWHRDRPFVPEGSEPSVGIHWVTLDYFGTVRLPLLRGRNFTARDRADAPRVVIINETLARKLFPGENPIGRRIGVGQGGFSEGAEIIGIVADQRFRSMEAPPEPDVYISMAQSQRPRAIIFLRTSVKPTAVLSGVRREVQRIDPNLPVYDAATMEERVGNATARTRVTSVLLTLFAGVALVLSLVGIYGVVAYAVTQRTREIGLRIALGAERSAVAGLVLRYGTAMISIGLTAGLLGAFAATRVLRSMLYEVRPTDPTTFAVLTVVTGLVALAGTAAPAWRATRVDPLTALKSE
jgi:putative ABC transport system permease protein